MVGFGLGRDCWKCLTALAALQVIVVQAQQVSGTMDEAAMWTPQGRQGDVVVATAGHRLAVSLPRRVGLSALSAGNAMAHLEPLLGPGASAETEMLQRALTEHPHAAPELADF